MSQADEKPIEKWTTNDFIAYLCERHIATYGVEYRPARNWQAERGLLGTLIGTKGRNAKPRKYEPAVVKAFIDECLRTHRCTPEYPGASFTWFWTYKTSVWQRVLVQHQRKQLATQHTQQSENLEGWF